MWKKRLAVLGVACMSFLTVGITAHAGNINAAEQSVIDFYNGTFTYNGKNYQATESAKSAAYNKLMADDVDLTAAQAKSAIRQARANIKKGIDEGHLVEVGGSGSETGGDGNQESNSGGTGTGDNAGSGGNENNPGSANPSEPGNGNSGAGDNEAPGTPGETGFDWGNPGNWDDTGSNFGTGTDGSGIKPKELKKIDIDGLFRKLQENKEHSTITGFGNKTSIPESSAQVTGNSFTVEQYLEGKAMAVTKDGEVLLETGLPIKNTGFYNGDIKKMAIAAAIIFLLVMIGVIWSVKSKKDKKAIGYLGVPLLFAFILVGISAFFLSGTLGNQLAKWNCLWIAGAPGYSYANTFAQGSDTSSEDLPTEGIIAQTEATAPISGDQYGELACEDTGLQAPLYYGDSEEILEKGAGTYAGGYLPGMGGTILIGAHDATFFAPLETIKEKDVISLTTAYGKYQYSVTKTQAADLMDTSAYKITDDGESLILYTCYPFGAEDKVRDQRYYVYAEKISGPEIGE